MEAERQVWEDEKARRGKGRKSISPSYYGLLGAGTLWEPARDGMNGVEIGVRGTSPGTPTKDFEPCVQISPGGKLGFCPRTERRSVARAGWRLRSNGLGSPAHAPLVGPRTKETVEFPRSRRRIPFWHARLSTSTIELGLGTHFRTQLTGLTSHNCRLPGLGHLG